MEKSSKKYLIFGIIFSLFAITFGLLHYFKVIKSLDLFLSVTYIAYFVGIALLYNGAYNRNYNRTKSTLLNFVLGGIFILAAIVMLIYGLATGIVIMF